SGSGADSLERFKPYIDDGKTVVASPHRVFGPQTNDLVLQLRKRRIGKVILGGMLANMCVESHLRDLLEQGFEVVVARDATAAPRHPEWGYGYTAALINFKAMVSVSGYLIGSQEAGKMPLPPKAEVQRWYQYYFATERGRAGYEKYRHDFAKLIWQIASPKWRFDDATFDRSAASFNNPDHVSIVIHNYRWRLGLAEGESKYDDLEKQ